MAYANILVQIIQIACLQNIVNQKEKYARLSVAQAKTVLKDLLALLQKGHVINRVRNKRIARKINIAIRKLHPECLQHLQFKMSILSYN